MDLDKATVLGMLGSDAYYSVPEFQRDYVWRSGTRVAEVDQLLQDLATAYQDGGREPYFLGSMVVFDDSESRRRMLVDGQQRTVTLVILLSAIHHRLKSLVSEFAGEPTDVVDQEALEELSTSLRWDCPRLG